MIGVWKTKYNKIDEIKIMANLGWAARTRLRYNTWNSLRRVLRSLPGGSSDFYQQRVLQWIDTIWVVKMLCRSFWTPRIAVKILRPRRKDDWTDVEGPAEVTVGDILTDSDIEIVKPYHYLFTIVVKVLA